MFNPELFYAKVTDRNESEKWTQISTLKMFNQKVDEIVPGILYHVPFQSNSIDFILKIQLCNLFPERKPLVFLQPIARHDWIDMSSGQICNAPGLLNFTKHSDLGRVVQVIIREFIKNGLLPIQQSPTSITNKSKNNAETINNQLQQSTSTTTSTSLIKPVIQNLMDLEIERSCDRQAKSELYPELNKMSTLELQIFAQNSDEQLQKFLDERNYSQMITNRTKELRRLVTEIASENYSKKSEYDQLKMDVAERTDRIINAISHVTELQNRFESLTDKYKPTNLCLLVENQSKADDKRSEKFASDFLDGHLQHSAEQFIHEYVQLRKRHFLNKIKAENFRTNRNSRK